MSTGFCVIFSTEPMYVSGRSMMCSSCVFFWYLFESSARSIDVRRFSPALPSPAFSASSIIIGAAVAAFFLPAFFLAFLALAFLALGLAATGDGT